MKMSRSVFVSIVVLVLLSGLLASCGGGGGATGGGDPAITTGGTTTPGGGTPAPTTGNLSGTVQADPADSSASGKNANATVYVVGQQNNSTTTDSSGNFTMNANLSLSGTVLASPSLFSKIFRAAATTTSFSLVVISEGSSHGRKIEFTVTNGTIDPLSTIYINTVGSITGKATLQGASDHTGIRVFIPGTSFQATTNASGNYTISNVPSGTYDLVRADYPGTAYKYAIVAKVTVNSNQATTLPDMFLQLSQGASGQVLINKGDAFTTSKTVNLNIAPSDNTVLMAISEDANFGNVQTWEPVTPTKQYTFSGVYTGSTATIYVKFADMSGLATAGHASDTIIIDTNPLATKVGPGTPISSTKPTLQWTYAQPMPTPKYDVQVSSDPAFGTIQEEASNLATNQYTLAAALNQGTWYWRVRIIDAAGTVWSWSSAFSFSISLDTVTLSAPVNDSYTLDSTPTFTWTQNANAASYIFTLSPNANLSSALVNTTTNTTSFTAGSALPDLEYFWAVTPVDVHGISGTQSAISKFVVDTLAPTGNDLGSCPSNTLVSPVSGRCTGVVIASDAPFITGSGFWATDPVNYFLSASDDNAVAEYCVQKTAPNPFNPPSSLPAACYNWNPVTPTASFTLPVSESISAWSTLHSVVCVWFKDRAGNTSQRYCDDIRYAQLNSATPLGATSILYPALSYPGSGIYQPGIAYYDATSTTLKYIQGTSSPTTFNTPVVADSKNGVGKYASIAFTNHGTPQNETPHISYFDEASSQMRYTYKSGASFTTPVAYTAALPGGFTRSAIAIDSNFNAHFVWTEGGCAASGYGLWYKYWNGSTWSSYSVVDCAAWASRDYPSMIYSGTTATGAAHISFQDISYGYLKYATGNVGGWNVVSVDMTGYSTGKNSRIVSDENGGFHISYARANDSFTDGVGHAYCASSCTTTANWVKENVTGNVGGKGPETAITTCREGGVISTFVLYTRPYDGSLRLATNRYGAWSETLLDTGASAISLIRVNPTTCELAASYTVANQLQYIDVTMPKP